jgi:hypothetical protein
MHHETLFPRLPAKIINTYFTEPISQRQLARRFRYEQAVIAQTPVTQTAPVKTKNAGVYRFKIGAFNAATITDGIGSISLLQ